MSGDAYRAMLRDLAQAQDGLSADVAGLSADGWARPTPAAGWDVRDQIAHLTLTEDFALASLTDPVAFGRQADEAAADQYAAQDRLLARGRALPGPELLARWTRARHQVRAELGRRAATDRVEWFGPSMSCRSFATARLMETWAHGTEVRAALGLEPTSGPHLRHIAHLGVATLGWSLAVHGSATPPGPVRVELEGGEPERWVWGPEGAADSVVGTALDFCLVVTQRRHVTDTDLCVRGELAGEWMRLAQAFAGPPTTATRTRVARSVQTGEPA